jgi:hypothetical protein
MNSKSQFVTPSIFDPTTGHATPLERLELSSEGTGPYDESWLQKLLFTTRALLPIEEIEATFTGAIPVCRELETDVGPLDLLFINEHGLLTFVECKLWRNPEARRKVVGQILDYAQEISRWSYEDLDEAVRKAVGRGLWDIARDAFGLDQEATYIDRVTRHLRNGTFLLLVVGDGIRENTEAIAGYLNKYAGLGFALGLVEEQIFRLPGSETLFVQPRVLAKTVEIGRLIVRSEQSGIIVEHDAQPEDKARPIGRSAPVSRTLTENLFVAEVAGTSDLAPQLRRFFDSVKAVGLRIEPSDRGASLIIFPPSSDKNLLTLERSGNVRNYGLWTSDSGRMYLQRLSALIRGTIIKENTKDLWRTTITRADGKAVRIEDVVAVSDRLIELMKETAQKFDAPPSESRPPTTSELEARWIADGKRTSPER